MKNSYPFKVWVATILSASVLLCFSFLLLRNTFSSVREFCSVLLMTTLTGFLSSIPAFFVNHSIFNYISKQGNNKGILKLTYILISIISAVVALMLIMCIVGGSGMMRELVLKRDLLLMFLAFFTPYAFCIVVYGMCFKVESKT